MFNPYLPILNATAIEIPLLAGKDLFQERMEQAAVVCNASGQLVNQIITWEDYLDQVEIVLPDMDAYLEQIESLLLH